jgi:hypothetical protein
MVVLGSGSGQWVPLLSVIEDAQKELTCSREEATKLVIELLRIR